MELTFHKARAIFNKSPNGSSKLIVWVEFPNCVSKKTGLPFKWMPTWAQLDDIKNALTEIEYQSWQEEKKEVLKDENKQ